MAPTPRSNSFSSGPLLPALGTSPTRSIDSSPEGSLRGSIASERTYQNTLNEHGAMGHSTSSKQFRGGYESVRSSRSNSINVPTGSTASEKFSIPIWESAILNAPEEDDWLHNPNAKRDRKHDQGGTIFTLRGMLNLGCLFVLVLSLLMLFAGYPILSYYQNMALQVQAGKAVVWEWDLAKINGSLSQHDWIQGRNFSAIDPETPADKRSIISDSGETWDLVFSDEFNTDGRSFYDGDDPFWQAVDLHAWSTDDMEWYDPRHVTTKNGSLQITMINYTNHDLYYQSAEIQSWNRLCFLGGRLEVSASLPGRSDVYGLWPAVWTMGNLGRPGYGGTTEGMWPYSYNSCDLGAAPNQTLHDKPEIALTSGWTSLPYNGTLSYLPGQRLSRCVCESEYHPGPKNTDGSWVGRSAPEIDLYEAQVDNTARVGQVSQSVQWAPFNAGYGWNTTAGMDIYDDDITKINSYSGGPYQQAASGISTTDKNCYQYNTGCYSVYAFEYQTGTDGYITWFSNDAKVWTYLPVGMAANSTVEVSQRQIPYEPMHVIINLAFSTSFTGIDWTNLPALFPVVMSVNYVRIYQDTSTGSTHHLGCDPPSAPTTAYIERYLEAYSNPNITTWAEMNDGNSDLPRNNLTGTC